MKALLILSFLMITSTSLCFADNPPLPCNTTWQQGGLLINGQLYQEGHPLPKNKDDFWIFTNTRPGYNFSFGWYHLICGQPVNVPFDDHFYFISFIFVIFITYKTYQHDKRTASRNC